MPQTADEEKLYRAAKEGDLDGVNAAIAAGANVETKNGVRGRTISARAPPPPPPPPPPPTINPTTHRPSTTTTSFSPSSHSQPPPACIPLSPPSPPRAPLAPRPLPPHGALRRGIRTSEWLHTAP